MSHDLRSALLSDPSDLIHLNNCGVAPMHRAARKRMAWAAELHGKGGTHGVDELMEAYVEANTVYEKLLDAPEGSVSMMQTCATAVAHVALGLELSPGDEIIRMDQEYPSNAYVWHEAAKRADATVTVLKSRADYSIDQEALEGAISSQTKIVAISWIQFQTGASVDLKSLASVCHKHGAYLSVDAIQGLGMVPFSMRDTDVDFVCGGTHKWLLGPLGHGFLAIRPGLREKLRPLLYGAVTYGEPGEAVDLTKSPRTDAYRFQSGAPHLLGALGGAASIECLLNLRIEVIYKGALERANLLREKLKGFGAEIIGDSNPAVPNPIVTFQAPRLEHVSQKLREAKISHAERACGIRLGVHAFNTEEEVDAVARCLG